MRLNKVYFYFNNIFWLVATCVLAPFFYLCIFFKKRKKRDKKKILVIPPVKIGDLVCSTHLFREIKKRHPKSHVAVALLVNKSRAKTAYDLIKHNQNIDEIITLPGESFSIYNILKLARELHKKDFDWVFGLNFVAMDRIIAFWSCIPNRAMLNSAYANLTCRFLDFFINYHSEIRLHYFAPQERLRLLRFIGINDFNDLKTEVFTSQEEEKQADNFLSKNNLSSDDFLIGVALTAGNKIKEWPKDNFIDVANKLIEKYKAKIIFIGGPRDKDDIDYVRSRIKKKTFDTSRDLSLIELAALMRNMNIFISVDTGPLYLANAMGVSVVNIAGPIDVNEQPPLGDKCEIVQKKLSCVPCSYVIKTARFCKRGDLKCVEDTKLEDVLRAVEKLINKNEK